MAWSDVDLARVTHEYLQGQRSQPCPTCGRPFEITRSREPPQPPIKLVFTCRTCAIQQVYQRAKVEDDPNWTKKERKTILGDHELGIKMNCPRDEIALGVFRTRLAAANQEIEIIYCDWCGRRVQIAVE